MNDTNAPFTDDTLQIDADRAADAIAAHPARAEELIQAWVAAGNAAAVHEIAERGTGAARKVARRGLNILKSRGVPIPSLARLGKTTDSGRSVEEAAWLVTLDAVGTHLVSIASRLDSTSKYRACLLLIRDDDQVLRVENLTLSRSKLLERMQSVAQRRHPASVPVAWARAKVAAARRRGAERGAPEPLGLSSASSLLEPAPDAQVQHPFDAEGFELGEEDAKLLAQESNSLHALPEFRNWLPDADAVRELFVKVGERVAPGDSPNEVELGSYFPEEIAAATDRYFTPERREALVDVMKDAALSALPKHGEQFGLKISATMQRIAAAGLITDPPREIPFLRGFFEKAVAWIAARNGGTLNVPVPSAMPSSAGPEGEVGSTETL